ncbi:MAG: hypothetical protein WAL25_05835, partial [Acidimicrobiia bacterium]
MAVALMLSTMTMAFGAITAVTPSTNDANSTKGWAHFEVGETRVGEVDITFVSTRNFASCFEYRSDGEDPTYPVNPNPDIEGGAWPFVCVFNGTDMRTLSALEYVEIRMVFGAETDERFDWTRVDVVPVPGAHGLQVAKSGPAGDRANENARFNQGNDNAGSNQGNENANESAGLNHANESAGLNHANESAGLNHANESA